MRPPVTIPYVPNPFQVTGPVDEAGFFGREQVTEKVLAYAANNHIYLMGMRRSGKTSLLYHLREFWRQRGEQGTIAVFLDLTSAADAPNRLAEEMGNRLTLAVRKEFKRAKLPAKITGRLEGDIVGVSTVLNRIAEKNGLRIVLLLDEAEQLLDLDVATQRRLQTAWVGAQHLRIVLTASKGLAQIGGQQWRGLPFLGNYTTIRLPPMCDKDAASLIRRSKPSQPGLDVPDEVLRAIMELSGNWPSLIQWLCSNLYQPRERRWTPPDPRKSVLLNEGISASFQDDYDVLSPTERTIVALLAHGPASASILAHAVGAPVDAALDSLQEFGYVRGVDAHFQIGNAFLKRWLIDNVTPVPVPLPVPPVPPLEPQPEPSPTSRPVLELIVKLSPDRRTLSYELHSLGGEYNHQPMGSVPLRVSPETILEQYFRRLSTMARRDSTGRLPDQQQNDEREQQKIGNALYLELFSPELKREWEKIRVNYADAELQITSDDPWIPWELVRPYSKEGRWNDLPLCETFRLTRWVSGRGAPDKLRLQNASLVHASKSNLAATQAEIEYISGLSLKAPGFSVNPPLHTRKEVIEAFRCGQSQLLHFACHGGFDPDNPNDSKLVLDDGFLTPEDLLGECETGLGLVFVNACQAAAQSYSLVQVGGWATQFINADASVFIGPLWNVNDRSAAEFASAFYDHFFGIGGKKRKPLATAFREARLALKLKYPGDPTWLAYVLYGNPRAEWQA